jgi:hypothetical protein
MSEAQKTPDQMNREELNAYADGLGIASADYSRKEDLLNAVMEQEDLAPGADQDLPNDPADPAPDAGAPDQDPSANVVVANDSAPMDPEGDTDSGRSYITVKSAKEDGRTAFWERSEEQPNGEVFVSGNGRPVKVAATNAVYAAITSGRLVEAK